MYTIFYFSRKFNKIVAENMLQSKTLIHRVTKLGKLLKAVTVLIKSTPLLPKKKSNQIKLCKVVWNN